jgi:hypothetical protein
MKVLAAMIGLLIPIALISCGPGSSDQTASIGNPNADYYVYVANGYPTASALGVITKWTRTGAYMGTVADYSNSPGYFPQGMMSQTIGGQEKLLSLSLATTGRIDSLSPDGSSFNFFFENTAGLIAGTHRIVGTSDSGYLISRTAGIERFTSAKTRVGVAARYGVSGTCAATAVTGVGVATVSGTEYVMSSNAAATPNNKLNLYTGSTGACIVGAAPAGPAATMWPVDLEYAPSESKLFVLYYPFTAATSNAQIWSFDVSGAAINNGTLAFDDTLGEIAIINATPQNLSSALSYYTNGTEKFLMVGTSNNTVLKLNYSGGVFTKDSSFPFIYANVLARSISDVIVMDQ